MSLGSFERSLALGCGMVRPRYFPLAPSVALYDSLSEARPAQMASGRLGAAAMSEVLAAAQWRFPDQECIVFFRHHWFMGGLQMRLATFWSKALDLLHFDGDTVFAVRADGREGVVVDFDDSPGPEGGYEVFTWGERWPVYLPPELLKA